jgi:hypothetical protein
MRALSSIYFFGAVIMYALVQLLRSIDVIQGGLINSYATDLLCMPIVLSVSLYLVRKIKRDNKIVLTLPMILFMVGLWGFYFEWFLPSRSPLYTSDPVDIVMYLVGGISFYLVQKYRELSVSNN